MASKDEHQHMSKEGSDRSKSAWLYVLAAFFIVVHGFLARNEQWWVLSLEAREVIRHILIDHDLCIDFKFVGVFQACVSNHYY